MRINRWAGIVAASGTVLAVASLPAPAQAAAQTLAVQAGANAVVKGVGFEGMRFLAPPTLTVHKGDTLSFQFKGLDTATFLPVGQSPDEWAAENIEAPGAPYSLIVPDSDDASGAFEFSPADAFPSDPSCGTASAPCTYDGKSVVNSGLSLASPTFDVTVNANPGDVFWVLSFVHVGMDMRVQVVDDGTASTTQDAINSYAASRLVQDREAAAALIPKLQQPTRHKSGGTRVWDAYAGFDQPGWALDAMFPSALHIHKGDTVRWHFDQITGNVHTVTFPRKQALALNVQFPTFMCEGTPQDSPPDAPPPAFCSSGPQNLELELPAQTLLPVGNHRYAGTSSGLHSSGAEGAGTPTNAPYDLTFTHASHKKGFRYACIIHGGMMSGTVIVKP
jgi:plastocyanin